ncbi:MAG: T9SS type A sorting domain-containing protein, partial [Clostridia bacterium]|nr:T9SS type A sorting domain-containing protein [Clostridia bacterium]
LRVYLHNDFINNGPMDIDHLTFAGAADQTISSTAKSGIVTVDNVYDTVPESEIVFGSDFTFVNSVWNLAGATIDLQGGNFTMQNGDLQNGLLRSSNKYIRQIGDARLTNMQMSDIRLKGFCQIYGDGSHFTDVIVEDTLRNYNTYYSPTVTTSGDFINNGYITQWSSYSIYFNVQDVVINNGYWLSQKIIFGGNDMHYIGSQNAKVFNIANISASIDAGDVTVLSDLYLLNANVNLGGKNLYIPAGGTLNLDGGTIQSTLVTGNESATIHCSNAPLFDISTFTNVIISGTVNTKVNTFADCELEGLMQNFIYYFSPTISFEGNFTNTGTLTNAPAWSYKLSNNVFGNVYNSGTWEIAESNWKGLLDQDIYLMDDSEINTPSKFLAMLGTGNYQWYKNNVAINGATTNHLDFAAITDAERGFYHCTTNAGTSRTVRICTPIQISLADEAFFCQNESVMIEATPTSGQGPYIYSWTPAAGLSNPNIRNPLANPAQPTIYTCIITDAIGCSGEATILVQQYPQLYVQAGADDQICAGSSTSLSGSASGGALNYSYAWTPAAGLSNPNLPNPAASPSLTTTYTLTVTDGNGCQATDQVTITVNPLPIAYQLSLGGHFCAGVQAAIVKIADSEIGVNYYLRRNNQNTGVVMPGTGSAITFFTIPLAGTYTVKGINATTGCEKMMTGSVSVIIDNAPVITNQSGDDQKIVGSSKSFFVNATGTAPLTYAWYFEGDLVQSGAQNTYTKSNLTLGDAGEYWCIVSNNCGFEQSATIVLTVLDKQSVMIHKGWSGVSTYLNIWDNQVSDIFQSISNSLILVNDFEHIYWPGQNINTYPNGAWDTYTGAQIKLSAPATVDFIGLPLNDLTVDLTETWTYLPVLHQTPVAAEDLFMQAQPQIVIAKEIAGTGVYWPQYGINTLNVLTPGKAYLVKVSGSTSVDFDLVAKSGVISINPIQPENASPWNDPVYSNSSHTIALTNEVAASTLKPGDWFGVFNADGICCGIMKFDGNSTAITAFGDDPTTNDVNGMVENDRMFFKAYRSATDEMFDLQVGFDASANESAYFIANGMSVISDLKAKATGVSDAEQNLIRVYPNPTNGILNIEGISADSKVEITNAAGQLIYKSDTRGSQTINLGGQARGLYNVRITNQQFTTTRKVMVE